MGVMPLQLPDLCQVGPDPGMIASWKGEAAAAWQAAQLRDHHSCSSSMKGLAISCIPEVGETIMTAVPRHTCKRHCVTSGQEDSVCSSS